MRNSRFSWILLFIALCAVTCTVRTDNKSNTIVSFEILQPNYPTCPILGFKLFTNDLLLLKEKDFNKYKVKFNGAFFSDSSFFMADTKLKLWDKATLTVATQSCFFAKYTRKELDSITSITLDQISIIITKDTQKWVFISKRKYERLHGK